MCSDSSVSEKSSKNFILSLLNLWSLLPFLPLLPFSLASLSLPISTKNFTATWLSSSDSSWHYLYKKEGAVTIYLVALGKKCDKMPTNFTPSPAAWGTNSWTTGHFDIFTDGSSPVWFARPLHWQLDVSYTDVSEGGCQLQKPSPSCSCPLSGWPQAVTQ